MLILFAEDALPLSSWILWVYVKDAEWYNIQVLQSKQTVVALFVFVLQMLHCISSVISSLVIDRSLTNPGALAASSPLIVLLPFKSLLTFCCNWLTVICFHFYTFTSSRLFIDISLIRLVSDPESLLNGVTVPLRNSSEIHLSFETALTVWPWCLILKACAWSAPSGPNEKCFTYCKSPLLSGCRVNLTSFSS